MKFVSVLSVLLCTISHQAVAGFEWVAPTSNPTARSYSVPATQAEQPQNVIRAIRTEQPLPTVILNSTDLMAPPAPSIDQFSPITTTQPDLITLPLPELSPVTPYHFTAPEILSAPTLPNTPSFAPTLQTAPPLASTDVKSSFAPVVGFGDELPLALALRDIIPEDYSYRFSRGVNPGVAVSWDGQGQPWDLVVAELLAPHNLGVMLKDRQVIISPKAVSVSAVITPASATPMLATVSKPVHGFKAVTSSDEPFAQFQHGPIDLLPAPDAP